MMINRDLLDWQNRWTKCKEGKAWKTVRKIDEGSREPHLCTTTAQLWGPCDCTEKWLDGSKMWDVCPWGPGACVSVWTFHVTSTARWEGLLLCPRRPMLGPGPRCRRAGVPKPCCLFLPSFFLCLLFPSLPPPYTLLFSRLPPHAFLLFPVCSSSSFLTSRLPPLCHCFPLQSVVRHVSPVRRAWCLMFVLKRFTDLNSFQVFKMIRYRSGRLVGDTVGFDSAAGIPFRTCWCLTSHAHSPALFASEHMGLSHGLSRVHPLRRLDVWAKCAVRGLLMNRLFRCC